MTQTVFDSLLNWGFAECKPLCGRADEEIRVPGAYPVYPEDAFSRTIKYEEYGSEDCNCCDGEGVLDFHASGAGPEPLALDRSPKRRRASTELSVQSAKSNMSTNTARPGEVARMAFDLVPGEYVYDEGQLSKIASLQHDGSVVITGMFTPLAVTTAGHPGVLPGDTIQRVMESSTQSPRRWSSTKHSTNTRSQLDLALLSGGELNLQVSTRPGHFDVEVCCEGREKLGLLVTIERQHADRIKVQAVHDHGLLADWNRENPHCQVMPGDWITRVNGEANSAQEMAKSIRDCKDIQLSIETPPRMMGGVVGSIKVGGNTIRNCRQLPGRARVGTADWQDMQQALRASPVLA